MNSKQSDKAKMAPNVDPHAVLPYGDTLNDGLVQVSFSLPVALSPEATEAAKRTCIQMGLKEPGLSPSGPWSWFFLLHCLRKADQAG